MAEKNDLDLLNTFEPEVTAQIMAAAMKVKIQAGDDLFRAGDEGNALFVLLRGSLGVYIQGPSGYPQLFAIIKPGETVGEMAVISGEERSATVTAIRDSELIKLSASEFHRLVKSEPAISHELNRMLVHRLQQAANQHGLQLEPKTIAILPANNASETELVCANLCRTLDSENISHLLYTSQCDNGEIKGLAEIEARHDLVLFQGKHDSPGWNEKIARQADRIMVIANGRERPFTNLPMPILHQRARHQLLDLVIVHDQCNELPKNTNRWLKKIPVNRHFHICEANADWQHLARILTGRGLGLVFSGGGARAYAHIGVLKAVHELGMTVDFIGGSSMGAIIAACHARGWDFAESKRRIYNTFVRTNPLSDYTLPILSLVRGKKVERLLHENFGDARIIDLWKPFFCASSNLTSGLVHIHRKEKVWRALRASIALPGILPPIASKHGILVDGGVLDNLPVDVMRGINRGPVIAVDVAREHALDRDWLRNENKLPWYKKLVSPPIMTILMRAGTVGGEANNRQQIGRADLTITPPLGGIEIRQWDAFDQAIEIGYLDALARLKAARSSLLKQS